MPGVTYKPTTKQVAVRIRARVVDQYGNKLDDFSEDTSPKQTEVQEQIDDATQEVAQALGSRVPEEYEDIAKSAVSYLAAANVEMSFYAEQAGTNNSTYERLMERYKTLISQLSSDVGETVDSAVSAEGGVGGFPPPSRWESRRW